MTPTPEVLRRHGLLPPPVERMAFETDQDAAGYSIRAFYTQGPLALVEVQHNRLTLSSFHFEAYRVWNIYAHAPEVIADVRSRLECAHGDRS